MADAAATATADSVSNTTEATVGSPASGDSNVSAVSESTQATTTRAQAEEALQNLVDDAPATEEPETSEEQQRSEPEPEATEPEGTGEEIEGEAELGDKGKKALNRMKAAVKASKHEAETLKARISELETQIFNANVEKAATGKLQHPELAMRLVEGVDATSDRKAEPEPEATEPEGTGEEIEGEAELGDKGKKALNRMKAAVKASKHEAETLKARISELETQIFNANVEKAATGKLQHPELAMRLVEGVDATSDRKAIDKAIDAILRKYPDMGVPAHDSTTDSLQELFGAKPTIPEGESRMKANAAVFGSQLAALGL